MKLKWICITAIILIIVSVLITGIYKASADKRTDWQSAPAGTVLVDYYSCISGTDGYDSFYELVLKKTESTDTVLLEKYDSNSEEAPALSCMVPAGAVEKCFEIIDGNKLHRWNKRYKETPQCGGGVSCSFFDGEKQVRVSTDCCPDNGNIILNEISFVIQSYVTGANESTLVLN